MCLSIFLLQFILSGTLNFLDFVGCFFPMFGKFSAIISSNIFLSPLSLCLLDPYNANIGAFSVVAEVCSIVFISFFLFLFSVLWQWFPSFCLLSYLTIFCFSILLLILSSVFFNSVIVLFSLFVLQVL